MRTKIASGFTLIELLIVIAILAILSTLGIGNFISSRIKAQDLARKSDLQTIAKSLEAYVNDHRTYPLSDSSGKIVCKTGNVTCAWGDSFTDDKGTVYAVTLPKEPSGRSYWYVSNGSSYTLYTYLENVNDPGRIETGITIDCKPGIKCNYKISSSNI